MTSRKAAVELDKMNVAQKKAELRGLFNDWLGEIELRVIDFVDNRNRVDPQELASHFKLTTESIIFVLGKLAREGKVTMEAKGKSTTNLRLLKREK